MSPPTDPISTRQLADATGLTYRQIDYWTRTGRLHALDGARGSGNHRHYDPAHIPALRIAANLIDAGLTPDAALRAARQLNQHGHADLAGYRLTREDVA